MKFVELTAAHGENKVCVNLQHIVLIYPGENKEGAQIYLSQSTADDTGIVLSVQETYEQVVKLVMEPK
jgi:hypothetical protein